MPDDRELPRVQRGTASHRPSLRTGPPGRPPDPGCARRLPTVSPTMQERVFPQLLLTWRLNAHLSMIETSRLCVDAACPSEVGGGWLYTT
ncbi:acyl-homoserine-lactone synthase [Rhizobium leguminosarum]|uniref:acyl-homoserine-lactone synthase n=1 Tax=Rhizobium leguminosarum TaxID=384 RepID=UPI0039658A6F